MLETGALLSGPPASGALASRVLASGALASELRAPEAPASTTLPGERGRGCRRATPPPRPAAPRGQTPPRYQRHGRPGPEPRARSFPGQPPAVVPGPEVAQGPVLPVPPRDDEKYRYVKRGAWILTLASLASFPLLLFSQTRLMLQYHWFWFYVPFVIMGALFLALPMITDGLARGFDFKAHQRLVDAWRPEKLPLRGRLPAGLR